MVSALGIRNAEKPKKHPKSLTPLLADQLKPCHGGHVQVDTHAFEADVAVFAFFAFEADMKQVFGFIIQHAFEQGGTFVQF